MKRILLTVALLVSLNANASDALRGDELAECSAEPQTVSVRMYANARELRDAYYKLSGVRARTLKGFATVNNRTGVHTLHIEMVLSDRSATRLLTLGHELLHALCGDWHPNTNH